MDNHSNIRTGIDLSGTNYLTAQVEKQGSSIKVLALSQISTGDLSRSLLSDNSPMVMSLSDNLVLFKNLTIPQNYSGSEEKILHFELEHSLLSEPGDICYDMINTSDNTRPVAMAAHKQRIENLEQMIRTNENQSHSPEGFLPRSVALGRGFIQFCSNDTERLVCLTDFSQENVPICLVLGNSIVALGNFDRKPFELESEFGLHRLAAELKTVINFKLSELSARGIIVELARFVICGSVLSENQKQAIASKLSVELEEPVLDRVLLDRPVLDSHLPVSDFLVSLGLTVE